MSKESLAWLERQAGHMSTGRPPTDFAAERPSIQRQIAHHPGARNAKRADDDLQADQL